MKINNTQRQNRKDKGGEREGEKEMKKTIAQRVDKENFTKLECNYQFGLCVFVRHIPQSK